MLPKFLEALGPYFCDSCDGYAFPSRLGVFGYCFALPELMLRLRFPPGVRSCPRELVLWSVACLFAVTHLCALSTQEKVEELPLRPRPLTWPDFSNPPTPPVFVLPEGTRICLEFASYVSTQTAKRNDPVRLQVVSDVRIAGLKVIPKGAEAWGIVTLAKKPGHFSRDGKLQIELQSVTLLNGQAIAIRVPTVCRQCGKWDLRSSDSLQAPLLALFAPVMLATMPPEDRDTVFGSAIKGIISKGNQEKRLPGTRIEAVVSRAVELNREEFSTLQPAEKDRDLGLQ